MRDDMSFSMLVIIVVGVVSALLLVNCGKHFARDTVDARVERKDVVVNDRDSSYRIWTDHEVFRLDDTFIEGNWDTSDDFGTLREGECYRLGVYGWRIQLLSWYRNIHSIEPIDCE